MLNVFGLSNFRSFGPEPQRLGFFNKVNLFIGPNNSGKSNILRFISRKLPSCIHMIRTRSKSPIFDLADFHERDVNSKIQLEFSYKVDSAELGKLWESKLSEQSELSLVLRRFLSKVDQGSELTYRFSYNQPNGTFEEEGSEAFVEFVQNVLKDDRSLDRLANLEMFMIYAGRELHQACKLSLPMIPRDVQNFPLILSQRQIREMNGTADDSIYDGAGLISIIGSWINHQGHEREKKRKKELILAFVREVTGFNEIELKVVSKDTVIEIGTHGESYGLSDVATGLHELVLLAAYCLQHENTVVCLEEPECHLHPTWQRALIDYLQRNTSNQYFIATHSAHIIDMPNTSVFMVSKTGSVTAINAVIADHHQVQLVRTLGYHASDLLQTNFILWVEGPSDRIYIAHWLSLLDPELLEGVHFSIMFYSGSMLMHLSPALEEDDFSTFVPDPIMLRRLNQNFGLVMDSDKTGKDSYLKQADWEKKQLYKEAMDKSGDFAWITAGRTTENYADIKILREAVLQINPDYEFVEPIDQYSEAYKFKNTAGTIVHSKVELAQRYVECQNRLFQDFEKESAEQEIRAQLGEEVSRSLMKLDLTNKLSELVTAIRKVQKR